MKTFNIFEDLSEMVSRGFARATDPQTSKEAGVNVNVSKIERIVLDAIKSFPGGCILQDIEHALPEIRQSSISPRIRPLIRKKLIIDTGEVRPSFSGRNQRVLKAVV